MVGKFFHKRLVNPIISLLKQGISPEKIAMGVAGGIVLGIFPVLGSTTILSGLAAVIFQLNLPAMQLVNYMVYPLHLALLIPFFHLGDLLFRAEPLPLTAQELIGLLQSDLWGTIRSLWDTTMRAIVAWLLVSAPFFLALYAGLIHLLKRVKIPRWGAVN
ncbi:MAG: DUF2062 domain-containing protein [Deltaproteobacteria bacterium]|nr:MAG: DUF2062 domain-containing protein [Deltaproteobacteria bacterium]